jgi:hypothetical protein
VIGTQPMQEPESERSREKDQRTHRGFFTSGVSALSATLHVSGTLTGA